MNPKLLLGLALVLGGGLFGCSTTTLRPPPRNHPSGPVTDGLQMSLSVSNSRNLSDPEFEVAIRNVGEKDCCLNLGMMLANGKVMIPGKIHLQVVDGKGTSWLLNFVDRRFPGIAGRLDDYVVPLKSGSTCTLELRLDQFVSSTTGDAVKLKPGRYEVSARLQGDGAETSNTDMAGMKLMNFWKGNLRSNPVLIEE